MRACVTLAWCVWPASPKSAPPQHPSTAPPLPLHASSRAQGACSDTPLAHLQSTRAAPAPAQRTPRRAGLTQGRGRPGTPPGCRPASGLTRSQWAQGAWTQHSRHAAAATPAAAAAGAGEGARMCSRPQDDAGRQAAVKGGCRPRQQHRAIAGGWVLGPLNTQSACGDEVWPMAATPVAHSSHTSFQRGASKLTERAPAAVCAPPASV